MKSKLLPYLLFLLILLNGVLIFMLIKKPHENRNRPERNFLTEQLQFSETQKDQFRVLDETHRNVMMRIDKNINEQKEVLFNSFSKENFNLDSLTNKIAVLSGKKESEVFNFFSFC